MQIVIDVAKEYYKAITEIPNHQCTADMLIIKNGTPLQSKKVGHWVKTGGENLWRVPVYECSECHTWLAEDNLANFQYCFKCGVKMEKYGKTDNDTN